MLVARTYFSVVPVLRITLIRTLALPVLPEPVRGLLFLCECRGHWTSKGPCDENEAEHEALATILARRAGAFVPEVVVAGASSRGDAIVATTWPGRPLDDGDMTDERAAALWGTLGELAAVRISHGRIEPDRLRIVDDELMLTDWDDSTVGAGDERLLSDGASILVATAVMRGPSEVRMAYSAQGSR